MILGFDELFNEFINIISKINNEIIRKFNCEIYDEMKIYVWQNKVDMMLHDSILKEHIKFMVSYDGKETVSITPLSKTAVGACVKETHGFYTSIVNGPTEEFLINWYDNVGKWLAGKINEMVEEIDDPCIDNFRVAEIDNSYEEVAYYTIANAGCCGFEDREVIHEVTNRKFRIGCNYGH